MFAALKSAAKSAAAAVGVDPENIKAQATALASQVQNQAMAKAAELKTQAMAKMEDVKAAAAAADVAGQLANAKSTLGALGAAIARGSGRRGAATCTSRGLFNKIDSDNSGEITLEEVIAAFNRADKDKSKTLTYEEFVDACLKAKATKKSSAKKAASKSRSTPKAAAKSRSTPKAAAKSRSTPKAAAKSRSTPKAAAKSRATPKKGPVTKKTASGVKRPSARALYDQGIPVGSSVQYEDGTVKCLVLDMNGRPYLGKC